MQHRSISQRLQKTRSPQVRQEIALEWAENWQQEQLELVQRLYTLAKAQDINNLIFALGELRAVTIKRLNALPNVVKLLT